MSLRRAENAKIYYSPHFLTHKGEVRLALGRKIYTISKMHRDDFESIQQQQLEIPVLIGRVGDRRYWHFQNAIYWENEGLGARQVHALLSERQSRRSSQIDRAEQLLAMDGRARTQPRRRAQISEEVKHFVWMRDQGRCRHCGSTVELQYDHIIPISKGGSSSPKNLQILCGPCNRRKGGSVRLPGSP